MAGVKPVEYKKDSSTTGFAVAGDQKQITKDNAVTIEKDVKQGNTNDLDNAQSKYLESQIEDVDNIEYSDDERKNVGKNQIDTDDVEKTKGEDKAAAAAGSAISAAGFMFGGQIAKAVAGLVPKSATSAVAAVACGVVFLGSGTLAVVSANNFDPEYNERTSQKDSAEETNNTIQSYYDQMAADMDTMTEDAATYADLSEQKVTADVDRITQIGALQAQIAVYQAQGDDEMVAQLQAQIAELTKEGEADETGGKIDELQQGLETYSGNNAEAVGVADSGATVSDFLRQGNNMGVYGTINSTMLAVATGYATAAAIASISSVRWPWDVPIAFAAAALDTATAALYITATSKMVKKTVNEFKCADAGSEMQDNVNNLLGNVEQQGGFTESTSAGYTEIATKNAETTKKTQEGVDKANKNTPVAPKPTGNGEGNNPDEEKPPVVGAGEGAAA